MTGPLNVTVSMPLKADSTQDAKIYVEAVAQSCGHRSCESTSQDQLTSLKILASLRKGVSEPNHGVNGMIHHSRRNASIFNAPIFINDGPHATYVKSVWEHRSPTQNNTCTPSKICHLVNGVAGLLRLGIN